MACGEVPRYLALAYPTYGNLRYSGTNQVLAVAPCGSLPLLFSLFSSPLPARSVADQDVRRPRGLGHRLTRPAHLARSVPNGSVRGLVASKSNGRSGLNVVIIMTCNSNQSHSTLPQQLDKVTPCCSPNLVPVCSHFSFLDLGMLHIPDTHTCLLTSQPTNQPANTNMPSSAVHFCPLLPTASTTGVCVCAKRICPDQAQTQTDHLVQTSSTRPQSLSTSHTTADAGQPSRAMTFVPC